MSKDSGGAITNYKAVTGPDGQQNLVMEPSVDRTHYTSWQAFFTDLTTTAVLTVVTILLLPGAREFFATMPDPAEGDFFVRYGNNAATMLEAIWFSKRSIGVLLMIFGTWKIYMYVLQKGITYTKTYFDKATTFLRFGRLVIAWYLIVDIAVLGDVVPQYMAKDFGFIYVSQDLMHVLEGSLFTAFLYMMAVSLAIIALSVLFGVFGMEFLMVTIHMLLFGVISSMTSLIFKSMSATIAAGLGVTLSAIHTMSMLDDRGKSSLEGILIATGLILFTLAVGIGTFLVMAWPYFAVIYVATQ